MNHWGDVSFQDSWEVDMNWTVGQAGPRICHGKTGTQHWQYRIPSSNEIRWGEHEMTSYFHIWFPLSMAQTISFFVLVHHKNCQDWIIDLSVCLGWEVQPSYIDIIDGIFEQICLKENRFRKHPPFARLCACRACRIGLILKWRKKQADASYQVHSNITFFSTKGLLQHICKRAQEIFLCNCDRNSCHIMDVEEGMGRDTSLRMMEIQ